MMGTEYFTVAAYMPEDSDTILCVSCGDAAGLPASDQITRSQFNGGDWNDGCYCDDCGAEIAAPYDWTCPTCETEYTGDEASNREHEYWRNSHGDDGNRHCSDECTEV